MFVITGNYHKILLTFIGLFLFFCSLLFSQKNSFSDVVVYVVKKDNVKVYSDSNNNSFVLETLYRGQARRTDGNNEPLTKGFRHVTARIIEGGKEGWVNTKYLSLVTKKDKLITVAIPIRYNYKSHDNLLIKAKRDKKKPSNPKFNFDTYFISKGNQKPIKLFQMANIFELDYNITGITDFNQDGNDDFIFIEADEDYYTCNVYISKKSKYIRHNIRYLVTKKFPDELSVDDFSFSFDGGKKEITLEYSAYTKESGYSGYKEIVISFDKSKNTWILNKK